MRFRVTIATGTFDWETTSAAFRLGRAPECALRFEGESAVFVSWEHAEFQVLADGAATVTDLGSSNGTNVDGFRIVSPTTLAIGSIIQIGRTGPRLELIATEPQSATFASQQKEHDVPEQNAAHATTTKTRSSEKWLDRIVFISSWIAGGLFGLALGFYVLSHINPERFSFDLDSILSFFGKN